MRKTTRLRVLYNITGTIIENVSIFAKKVKNRGFWRVVKSSKEELNKLTKIIRDYNITYQQTKGDLQIVITTIEEK